MSGPGRGAVRCIAAVLLGLALAAPAEERLPPALELVHSATPHDAIYDLEIHGQAGMAVGNHGVALESRDGGKSWSPVPGIDTPLALLGVARAGGHTLIVGQEGLVLRSSDGEHWEGVAAGTENRLLNVALHPDGRAFIVGAFGVVLRSRDYGASWEPVAIDWDRFIDQSGYEPHVYDVTFAPNGRVYVAGEFGAIISSADGGASWIGHNRGEESVFDLHLNPGGKGFAVGQEGLVLRTLDGGVSWERLDVPAEGNLLGVWSSEFDEVVIAGIRTLLRSSDNGRSWRAGEDHAITRSWYQALAAGESAIDMGRGTLTAEAVYVAGNAGIIARIVE